MFFVRKGFGFIKPDEGGDEIFVRLSKRKRGGMANRKAVSAQ